MARISKMAGALTEREFTIAARRYSRLSQKAIDAARQVLVNGKATEDVAIAASSSKQLVHKWATKIYEAFVPEGWETASVTLPPDQMAIVLQMEIDARTAWAQQLPEPRVVRR